uniref:Uncharacterized protein n=1 Tax=Strigamia maritima TaxID=126957 RepID=T1IQW5_STRMM
MSMVSHFNPIVVRLENYIDYDYVRHSSIAKFRANSSCGLVSPLASLSLGPFSHHFGHVPNEFIVPQRGLRQLVVMTHQQFQVE